MRCEKDTAFNNFALCYFAKARRGLPASLDVETVMDFYLSCCSIQVSPSAAPPVWIQEPSDRTTQGIELTSWEGLWNIRWDTGPLDRVHVTALLLARESIKLSSSRGLPGSDGKLCQPGLLHCPNLQPNRLNRHVHPVPFRSTVQLASAYSLGGRHALPHPVHYLVDEAPTQRRSCPMHAFKCAGNVQDHGGGCRHAGQWRRVPHDRRRGFYCRSGQADPGRHAKLR